MRFGLKDILMDVAEDSTTSIGADIAELSEEAPDITEIDKGTAPVIEDEEVTETIEEEEKQQPEVTEEEEEVPEVKDLHPFERPTIKDINKEFPELFKKFPSLKDMYFREAEYSKLFPTVEDAKEAMENNEAFTNIHNDVFSGDGAVFFSAIKEADEKGLVKFAGNVLPSLFKTSPEAFWRAANPLVQDVARNMFNKGVKDKNEDLQNAARYLSEYFFGDVEVAEGKKSSFKQEAPPDNSVKEERENFENQRNTEFRSIVSVSTKASLINQIDSKDPNTGKSRLDPDGVLSNFIKQTIIDRIINDIGTELTADKDHTRFMDSLWEKSRRNGRTDEDKARISSAYLARAKSLIPSLRSKYVTEALGGKQRASVQRKDKVEEVGSRKDAGASGKASNGHVKGYNPKSINYNKTSDEDILNDNITYK
jgi:hypothetical protein